MQESILQAQQKKGGGSAPIQWSLFSAIIVPEANPLFYSLQ